MSTFPPLLAPQSSESSRTVTAGPSVAVQSHPPTTRLWCLSCSAMSSGVRAYDMLQIAHESVEWPEVSYGSRKSCSSLGRASLVAAGADEARASRFEGRLSSFWCLRLDFSCDAGRSESESESDAANEGRLDDDAGLKYESRVAFSGAARARRMRAEPELTGCSSCSSSAGSEWSPLMSGDVGGESSDFGGLVEDEKDESAADESASSKSSAQLAVASLIRARGSTAEVNEDDGARLGEDLARWLDRVRRDSWGETER